MSYKLVDDERMQENVDLTKAYVSENAYLKDDTTETALADNDYIPFYDTSASSKKKSLWSNIKSVLKTYFDGIYLTSHQDISGKADKVSSATANNLAALDSNGNLTDSGKSKSATIPSGGTTGQVLKKKSGTNYDTEWGALATSKGSATKGVYFDANGAVQEMSYTVEKSVPSNAVFTDTKNTAGSTDSSSKLYLIGATSQAANPQTYSQDTAYVGTDGNLYSGSKVVATQNMIGDAWVTSHAYAVEDYCIDGNVLYKCKTAHTSIASYRPPYASYWDAVSVASQLKKDKIKKVSVSYTTSSSQSGKISRAINLSQYGIINPSKVLGFVAGRFIAGSGEEAFTLSDVGVAIGYGSNTTWVNLYNTVSNMTYKLIIWFTV